MALCSTSHHFSVAGFLNNHNHSSVCTNPPRHRACAIHTTIARSLPATASIDSGMSKNLYVRLASPDIYNIPPHQLSSKPSTARDSDLSSSGSGDPSACSPSLARWGRNHHKLSNSSGQAQAFAAACNVFRSSLGDGNQGTPPNTEESNSQTTEHTTLAGRDQSLRSADSRGVPVYVMLPLDSIDASTNTISRRKAMEVSLCALRSAGVEGVMVDVWWGVVERDEPGRYDWCGYLDLIRMVKRHGLKVQAVMSFHHCGGNNGDSCCIPLPKWVIEEFSSNPDLAFTDKHGRRNLEYLSFACDILPVLKGRSPVQVYADYMRSFKETFMDLIGDTIVEIQVGLGPAGELRYPSYPENNGTWKFPGIGEFQCYDKYMMSSLKAAANRIGKPEWGCGPSDAGCYSSYPEGTDFFGVDGGWSTPYGSFFLDWYSSLLLVHGERIFTVADAIFRSCRVRLSGRVASIYWHYSSKSHAAELTAGYYNTESRDGYLAIAKMFGRHGAVLNVSSVEMKDTEQPFEGMCSPESLIKQIVLAARKSSVAVSGNNALPRFDEEAFKHVVANSRLRFQDDPCGVAYEPMCAFTFLRMAKSLFQSNNWRQFVAFVRQMRLGRPSNQWVKEQKLSSEHLESASRLPLVQETATAATTLA